MGGVELAVCRLREGHSLICLVCICTFTFSMYEYKDYTIIDLIQVYRHVN